jgi:acyl-CoA oxidase
MTEAGHGSNVRDLRTTARYDREKREFVIDTPTADAYKDWIGNAGMHGRVATVFAQLEVDKVRHGVHAVLVPIRDEAGNALPDIRIEDCGLKEGLNGVDNGRIWFENVRVPRENLLNRFGDVSEDGTYTSPIPSQGRRFFTMLGTLVGGRISIAAAAVSAAKSGLTIAVRYAAVRRQFGPEGRPEVPILDYLSMQRRLLPALATTYAVHFAIRELTGTYAERGSRPEEVEAIAAGLKAWISRHTVETLQSCREACGGQGYLAANRLPSIKADTDVFTTFEGANAVLGLLVAKGLLTEYREQFGELRLWGVMRYVTGRAASAIADLNPIAPRKTDEDHLRDPAFHADALGYREQRLRDSLARRLRSRIESGEDSFDALNACQDHALALADAHVERRIHEAFRSAIESLEDEALLAVLRPLAALFSLSILERERGWYLEHGYFEAAKSKAIRDLTNRLCGEVRPHATGLVDAFGIPDRVLAAPIALT